MTKMALRWVRPLIPTIGLALGLSMTPSATAADAASDILTQVEDHCIQPGKPAEHFSAGPENWDRVSTAEAEAHIKIAALTVASWVAVEQDGTKTRVDKEVADQIRRYTQSYNDGEVSLFRHPRSGSVLLVSLDSDDWIHTDCVFWPKPDDQALQSLIEDRWALNIPKAKTSHFGNFSAIDIYIRRNNTPAQLNVAVYRIPNNVGPVPIILSLTNLTP